jgi:hypothetical protein
MIRLIRHARLYAGHLRLSLEKTWMAGTSPAMTNVNAKSDLAGREKSFGFCARSETEPATRGSMKTL